MNPQPPCWKQGYPTAAVAQAQLRTFRATARGRRLIVYRCRDCGYWHHRTRD